MKKLLLSSLFLLFTTLGYTQVVFYVEGPPSLLGNYDFSYATAASGWGVPDLTNPANAVRDTLVMVGDGTVQDSLTCGPVVNPSSVAGKIAVVYRGDCEFAAKAVNAQNAGAIAVVVINHSSGTITMGAGAQGVNVTIPVVMISNADGAILRSEILAGNVEVFIGSKSGFYANDLGFYSSHVLRPRSGANPVLISQDASEYDVPLGGWVYNFGQNNQTGITFSADITYQGTSLYSNTSAPPFNLNAGDSMYVTFPTFSQTSYNVGTYTLKYTINSATADDFDFDNSYTTYFNISDSIFTLSRLDTIANRPLNVTSVRSNAGDPPNGAFTSCIVFRDPNASRLRALGMSFSGSTRIEHTLDGKFVDLVLYSWEDAFVDLNDANFGFNNLNLVTFASYDYTADLQDQVIYVPFDNNGVILQDNQRYLACLEMFDEELFIGYDTQSDYRFFRQSETQPQPLFPILSPNTTNSAQLTWYFNGFGLNSVPALGLHVIPASYPIGIEEHEGLTKITPYPNPTDEFVNIPFHSDQAGAIDLTIYDIAGKLIRSEKLSIVNNQLLTVNTSSLAAGKYIFHVKFADEKETSFSVMINR